MFLILTIVIIVGLALYLYNIPEVKASRNVERNNRKKEIMGEWKMEQLNIFEL